MNFRPRTSEGRAAFGVTEDQERAISYWIQARLGGVTGADGRGGSGVFITLEDGRLALLTARHVVIDCLLTGELSVARLRAHSRHVLPTAIRIDGASDSALLVLDSNAFGGESLAFGDWTSKARLEAKGMPAIASGIVERLREPDQASRTIPMTTLLNLWTAIVDPDRNGSLIACDIDPTFSDQPDSFIGMSGGPLFSVNCNLLGINREEIRRTRSGDAELLVTPIRAWTSLYTPFRLPDGAPLPPFGCDGAGSPVRIAEEQAFSPFHEDARRENAIASRLTSLAMAAESRVHGLVVLAKNLAAERNGC